MGPANLKYEVPIIAFNATASFWLKFGNSVLSILTQLVKKRKSVEVFSNFKFFVVLRRTITATKQIIRAVYFEKILTQNEERVNKVF